MFGVLNFGMLNYVMIKRKKNFKFVTHQVLFVCRSLCLIRLFDVTYNLTGELNIHCDLTAKCGLELL